MDEKLIELVRQHTVLYDHGSRDYRDQNIRQTAWEEVGNELNISGPAAKESWEKLRRCFCNARNRRREETKSGMALKKKNVWKYENQMAFILPFLESRKTHSNLAAEPEEVSEDSEVEQHMPVSSQSEQGQESGYEENQVKEVDVPCQDMVVDTETNISRNKKQKRPTDNPSQQVVQILKENAELRKRKYEEKNSSRPQQTKSGILENLDDMDLFFLSMAKMAKKMPNYEQTQIKLALSNSVLSAELRLSQHRTEFNSQNQNQTESFYFSSPSPADSIHPITSPSDYSNLDAEYSERPTLLEMTTLSNM